MSDKKSCSHEPTGDSRTTDELVELTPREVQVLRMRFGVGDVSEPVESESDLKPTLGLLRTRGGPDGTGGTGGTPPAAFVAVDSCLPEE